MSSPTVINPELQLTVLNPELESATVLNPCLASNIPQRAEVGVVLGGRYRITEPLRVATGEADLYICVYDGREYVAKVYRRPRAIKPEVLSVLQSLTSENIASPIEYGELGGFPYEILPYDRNGSLQGRTYTLQELKETVIPSVNEALHVLHGHDLLHKDLKPSNIMLLDDGRGGAIIDFGISSVVGEGSTVLLTKTGMTPEYSAPETFRQLFLEESDYYSFGITLYELFCGYTPYRNIDADEIARFTAVQRIPFPETMPEELRELISAVTYFDITNRNHPENPNRRWTYEEVKRWCEGIRQPIPGESIGFGSGEAIPVYTFDGGRYEDLPTLVDALSEKWTEGKRELFRGHLAAFFKKYRPELARICTDAEEEAARNAGRDDVIFFEVLHRLCPGMKSISFKGRAYESPAALGRDMLEKLRGDDTSDHAFWDSILENKVLTAYLGTLGGENRELSLAVSAIETSHALINRSPRDALLNYYTAAYLLSGQKLFGVEGKQLRSVEELTAYMKHLLDASYGELERFCHRMVAYDGTLDVQLEAWLIALGKREALDAWRVHLAH
ncbi:MAG: protein kinase [Clostridia bacterium]|nr:protein kinase [Clostridia bacterium]